MRSLVIRTSVIAAAALALSACNRHPTVTNVSTNDLNANMTMSAPANDASAMESVSNTRSAAPVNATNTTNSTRDPGAGVSTNNVETNTVGM